MTTSIQYIVDTEATLDEAPRLADAIVQRMIRQGIVLETPRQHEDLTDGPRYATGPNVNLAADEVNGGFFCGLDVVVKRQVYATGEITCRMACKSCGASFDSGSDIKLEPAITAWMKEGRLADIECPRCRLYERVDRWFEPSWGFGNLAFEFYEWWLRPEFVKEIEAELGHKVTWVKCQI